MYRLLTTLCYVFKKCVERGELCGDSGGKLETVGGGRGFATSGLGQRPVVFRTSGDNELDSNTLQSLNAVAYLL